MFQVSKGVMTKILKKKEAEHQNHGYRKGNLDDFGLVTTNFATLNYHEGA